VQTSLSSVILTDKVGAAFPDSALNVQSLSSLLLVVHDPNSQSFALSYGPGHQQRLICRFTINASTITFPVTVTITFCMTSRCLTFPGVK
jgi:hypothetical protein